ncbi:probable Protein DOM34 [Saccharomycodes ludwigii]|uniref:Protein DOM34 homolog n=1 Tax=Saccharomycodes ludwigii TaxID=36035 RepID=A0A376BAP0_9ASCO|nr:hypothetical protein SCDLUD_003433 [Saccharomycodes ludwigii]KAH3900451.1 hypothetical protein SCDLUD_003433 [Saccharomycodes ludwigii]SSD61758.1 probable Protein DOM34 [Saccharomycodes ludwigii]
MKLLKEEIQPGKSSCAILTLLPQDKEDLFTIYNIINTDDEVIFKKMVTTKLDEASKKKNTDLVKLHLRIVSSEFEPENEFLRYKGITVENENAVTANVDIPIGKYFSFTIDFKYPFTLIKEDYNDYVSKLIKNACNVDHRTEMGAVVLQEGIAHVCLISPFSTMLKNKIEYSMPKKKRTTDLKKYDEKTNKFYRAIYDSMVRHFDFDKLKVVLLCSPGFWAKTLYGNIIKYAEADKNKAILTNKTKFLVAHCSTGYLQGIDEVLKNPAYSSKLQEAKNSKETIIMDEFLDHLNKDDYKAWYGRDEITKAAELSAIQTLLITDTILRSDDLQIRKSSLKLIKDVENTGGSVYVFSSLHSTGEELDKLTGFACILKYPMPDLDEDID